MKKVCLLAILGMVLFAEAGLCGGAWVPTPGDGDVQLGFSRKTASTSWNTDGETFRNLNNRGVVSYHDFRYAYLGSWAYFALILPFDLAFGYNYGYVGKSRPDQPSLIDVLGPWPQRLVAIILLVSGAMLLLLIPWEVARKWGERRRAAGFTE